MEPRDAATPAEPSPRPRHHVALVRSLSQRHRQACGEAAVAGWGPPGPRPPASPPQDAKLRRPRRRSADHDRLSFALPSEPQAGQARVASLGPPASAAGAEVDPAQNQDKTAAAKARAVASLQRLFFEELARGQDANGAAASALVRLTELTAGANEQVDPARSPSDSHPLSPVAPSAPRGSAPGRRRPSALVNTSVVVQI
mmetsp:Transcript_27750/g.61245  ORF Transcript_27750/g.61245 Transcript_27750/m.61245 type:complete len:200 (-) Transcript_27750:202-801(-)